MEIGFEGTDHRDPTSPRNPRNLKRAAQITAGVGIAHAVLLLIAFGIVRVAAPTVDAPDSDYVAFYQDDARRRAVLYAGIYVIPFAGIAFIWFTVALRMWLYGAVERLNVLFANLLIVCGAIYVTLLFCNGASLSMVSLDPFVSGEDFAIPLARQFPQYGASLMLIFAMRMAAMMVFALSNIARSTKIFPTWFIPVSFVVGITLLLTSSINPLLVIVFPVWLIIFCSFVIAHVRRLPELNLPGPVTEATA